MSNLSISAKEKVLFLFLIIFFYLQQVSKAKAAFVMERVRTEEELGRVRAEVILEEVAEN